MGSDEKLTRQRLSVLELAESLGNVGPKRVVSVACTTASSTSISGGS